MAETVRRLLAAAIAAAAMTAGNAPAQGWPAKPIRFVVNFAAGGGTVLVGNTPEAFATVLRNDYDRWGKLIRAAGTTAFTLDNSASPTTTPTSVSCLPLAH